MKYYTIQDNSVLIAENEYALARFYENIFELPEDYTSEKYIIREVDGIPKLVLNPDYPEIALEEVKQTKIKENDVARDTTLLQGVTYKDVLFDSDTDQKINLLAIVSTLPDDGTITWYGMNNDALECTKEDLLNIGELITQLNSFCWTKNAEIKYVINNATTVEEVNDIIIDYQM